MDQPASIEEAHVAALQAEMTQLRDQLLRALADLENTRKRAVREREDAGKYAAGAFARDMLSVADNLRRAIDSASPDAKDSALVQGVEATEREMLKAFEKNGIRRIEPLGAPFDPNFHEVMFESPMPGKADGTIIQILEAGYVLNDRLLRPARVSVVRNGPDGAVSHAVDREA
ncbi:MAG: nucleotide exchange factor GrpE [Rhodospirillales bacterium]|nr:nucleotide exchange factor GrpE [Rhodospirillales bacterium]